MVFSIWDVKKGLSLGQAVPLRPTASWAHTLSNGGDICIWVLVPAGIPTGLGDVHSYRIGMFMFACEKTGSSKTYFMAVIYLSLISIPLSENWLQVYIHTYTSL